MADVLSQADVQRIKQELGFNQLTLGAEPYIGVTRFFEQVAIPSLNAGALTTSSTAVTAASAPTPVALTVASAVGLAMFDQVYIDVDAAMERATIQAVSGSTITVLLSKAHTGTYPVSQEGGTALVRWYLSRLRMISDKIVSSVSRAGVKKVDEIELFGGTSKGAREMNTFQSLEQIQAYFRGELCKLLFGVGDIGQFGNAGARIGVY
jgi:hypothetical protein